MLALLLAGFVMTLIVGVWYGHRIGVTATEIRWREAVGRHCTCAHRHPGYEPWKAGPEPWREA